MKVYARTQAFTKDPLFPSLKRLKKMGFDGMEICFEHPEVMSLLQKNKISKLKDFLNGKVFEHFSCSYHQNLADDDRFEETKKAMAFSAALGARDFIIANVLGNRGDKALWDIGLARTKELYNVSHALGLRLLVEPEPVYVLHSTQDWIKMRDELGEDIYANIDLGHAFLTDVDPLGDIARIGSKVAHCHIENMAAGIHSHLLPWEGDMNLADYIDTLRSIDFDGPLALDLYREDYIAVAKKCLDYIKKLIDNSSYSISN